MRWNVCGGELGGLEIPFTLADMKKINSKIDNGKDKQSNIIFLFPFDNKDVI